MIAWQLPQSARLNPVTCVQFTLANFCRYFGAVSSLACSLLQLSLWSEGLNTLFIYIFHITKQNPDFDIHRSVHHNTILIKMTNKMQLCRIIYYSIVPWLLCMFRAILSLIIRSILTVITASGSIYMCCCRLLSWLLSHDSSRQQHMWMKPEAVITVKMLLMMGDNIDLNMYSSQGTME